MTNPAPATPVGAGPHAVLACAGLLAGSAVFIATARFANQWIDLNPRLMEGAGWIGLGLLVVASVWLCGIWWARRFRVSIWRLMVVVASVAAMLKTLFWLRGG